jgi:hypothetical protein
VSCKEEEWRVYFRRKRTLFLGTMLWLIVFGEWRTMCELCGWLKFNNYTWQERNSFQNQANSIVIRKNEYNCFFWIYLQLVECNNNRRIFSITNMCQTSTWIISIDRTTLSKWVIDRFSIVSFFRTYWLWFWSIHYFIRTK